MTNYIYETKIGKDRIAVLIGTRGEIKKQIEEATKVKITINSKEGDVFLEGDNAISLYTAREVVKAIARGFNPEISFLLLKPDYILDVINIKDYAKSKNQLVRLKGRVIGSEGKSRRTIEQLTDTYISIYGKTISIIGQPENTECARRAIESLLHGSPHSNVYHWLEKRRHEIKKRELLGIGNE